VTSIDAYGTELARYEYDDPPGYRIEVDASQGPRQRLLDPEHLEAIADASGNVVAAFQRGVVIDEVVNADFYDASGKPTNLTYYHDALQSTLQGYGSAVFRGFTAALGVPDPIPFELHMGVQRTYDTHSVNIFDTFDKIYDFLEDPFSSAPAGQGGASDGSSLYPSEPSLNLTAQPYWK